MACSVPSCPFRDKYLKQNRFFVPKDLTVRSTWERALGVDFHRNSRVCRQHFRNSDVIDTGVSGKGHHKYAVFLKKPRLRNGAIPISVREVDDGSVSVNDKTGVSHDSNDVDASRGDEHKLLYSINRDHCYTTLRLHENQIVEVNHGSGTSTMDGLERDAALFDDELTSSISKIIKVLLL